jgi:hypothetical protein
MAIAARLTACPVVGGQRLSTRRIFGESGKHQSFIAAGSLPDGTDRFGQDRFGCEPG